MKYQFFTVPARHSEAAAEVLNSFLASHSVVEVERVFSANTNGGEWVFCIAYQEHSQQKPASGATQTKRSKIDYRELLSPTDFAVYASLRTLRKQLADRDGVPAYAIFTNEQLATLVQQKVSTITELLAIDGIGEARTSKYGNAFLTELSAGAK